MFNLTVRIGFFKKYVNVYGQKIKFQIPLLIFYSQVSQTGSWGERKIASINVS